MALPETPLPGSAAPSASSPSARSLITGHPDSSPSRPSFADPRMAVRGGTGCGRLDASSSPRSPVSTVLLELLRFQARRRRCVRSCWSCWLVLSSIEDGCRRLQSPPAWVRAGSAGPADLLAATAAGGAAVTAATGRLAARLAAPRLGCCVAAAHGGRRVVRLGGVGCPVGGGMAVVDGHRCPRVLGVHAVPRTDEVAGKRTQPDRARVHRAALQCQEDARGRYSWIRPAGVLAHLAAVEEQLMQPGTAPLDPRLHP